MRDQHSFEAPPSLGDAFVLSSLSLNPLYAAQNDTHHSGDEVGGEDIIDDEHSTTGAGSALDSMAYDRLTMGRYERIMADIESMMNAHDYKNAAQELVNLDIGSLPQSVFDRFSDALEKTSTHLSTQDTYLNAQLASQSLTVFAIQDITAQENVFFVAESVSPSKSVDSLLIDMAEDKTPPLPILSFLDLDFGYGIADGHNPQLNSNTNVVADFMFNQTYNANREAALNNHSMAGAAAFNYDMKTF